MRITKLKKQMEKRRSDLTINGMNFHKKISESIVLVMVDFYADWCGPCKVMPPTIEELSKEYKDKVKIFKLNVYNARDIACKYHISSIPNVISFKDGKAVDQFIGALPKVNIENFIHKNI